MPARKTIIATRFVRFIKRILYRVDLLRGFFSDSMNTNIRLKAFKHQMNVIGL